MKWKQTLTLGGSYHMDESAFLEDRLRGRCYFKWQKYVDNGILNIYRRKIAEEIISMEKR